MRQAFLTYSPARRISAMAAKSHAFFDDLAHPCPGERARPTAGATVAAAAVVDPRTPEGPGSSMRPLDLSPSPAERVRVCAEVLLLARGPGAHRGGAPLQLTEVRLLEGLLAHAESADEAQ